mgnify:FL=1
MKEILCRVKSFITFDFPLDSQYIGEHFLATHDHYKNNIPHWSLVATRRKVISDYWFRHVLAHFGALYGLATLFVLLATYNFHYTFLVSVFVIGFVSFCVLFVTHYWLFYYSDFLPKLDTVIARHAKASLKIVAIENRKQLLDLTGKTHEKDQIFGVPDHWDPQATGKRAKSFGYLPRTWHQPAYVLSVEDEILWP